jgi:hypothetical protein
MYDPTVGRWLSTDPIEFEAGDTNLYRAMENAPTNLTDPSGLQVVERPPIEAPPPFAPFPRPPRRQVFRTLVTDTRASESGRARRSKPGSSSTICSGQVKISCLSI